MSSRVFRPELHQALRNHVESLLGKALLACDSSVENIWAIVLLCHWKDVGDKRGYNLIGFALRMATSADWYPDVRYLLEGSMREPGLDENEVQVRERRDKERLWMLLGNLDR